MNIEIRNLPPYYHAWVTNALSSRRRDADLIADLSHVRHDFDDMCQYYDRVLSEYDKPGKREGREHIVEATRDGKEYCSEVVATIDKVLAALNEFEH